MITLGIDMGSNTVKAAVVRDGRELLAHHLLKTSHDLEAVTRACVDACLAAAGATLEQCAGIVATGYGRVTCTLAQRDVSEITCHARGAHFQLPGTRTVIDIGGQDSKVMTLADNGRALDFVMNDKCAAGTGRSMEVMADLLNIKLEDIGTLSLQADKPEAVSSICAVLAETDVINMVSRGISAPNILKGIHLSMAARLSKLLKSVGAIEGVVMVTGGLALDKGLVAALEEGMSGIKGMQSVVRSHPDSIYAGAIGAALWGAFRFDKLAALGAAPQAA